jgi:type II secretory pathway component PulL
MVDHNSAKKDMEILNFSQKRRKITTKMRIVDDRGW